MTTALLLLALAAQASEIRVPAIVNGITSDEPEAVVALTVEVDGSLYGPFCSATLIDASWALTAAHCVAAMNQDYAAYDIYLVTGADLASSVDSTTLVQRGIAHPDYDSATYTDDIGLLELKAPGLLGVAPIPLDDRNPSNLVGSELRFMGYGITSDNAEDMGTKRYADIPVVTVDTDVVYAWDPEDGQNVCQGDSGGPALDIEGDRYVLSGVNAFVGLWKDQEGDQPCVDGFVGATRIDVHMDWIRQQTGGEVIVDTGGAGTNPWGGKDDPGWCAAAPRTGQGLGALIMGLAAVALRRRR
jgi:secreted trypsin-like serine protease